MVLQIDASVALLVRTTLWLSRRVRKHSQLQRALSEAFGTAVLLFFGAGSVIATLVLSARKPAAIDGADLMVIASTFGFVIIALVYALGRVSGCHINPAITLALAVTKRFAWRDVPIYWLAQLVGAVVGSLAVWIVFGQRAIDLGLGQTSFDSGTTGYLAAALGELIGTFVLVFAVLGIVDPNAPTQMSGIVIGLVVAAIDLMLIPATGGAINPARALGPEIVAAIGGGTTHWIQYVPAYLLPELAGGCLGALLYDYLAVPRLVTSAPIVHAVTETSEGSRA